MRQKGGVPCTPDFLNVGIRQYRRQLLLHLSRYQGVTRTEKPVARAGQILQLGTQIIAQQQIEALRQARLAGGWALRQLGTQQLQGLARMLCTLDLQRQKAAQGRIRIAVKCRGKLLEGLNRHSAGPPGFLHKAWRGSHQRQARDTFWRRQCGAQRHLPPQGPAKPVCAGRGHRQAQLRPFRQIGCGRGGASAMPWQLDDGQPESLRQPGQQGFPHGRIHAPAVQQDQIRTIAELLPVQAHADSSAAISSSTLSSASTCEAV